MYLKGSSHYLKLYNSLEIKLKIKMTIQKTENILYTSRNHTINKACHKTCKYLISWHI